MAASFNSQKADAKTKSYAFSLNLFHIRESYEMSIPKCSSPPLPESPASPRRGFRFASEEMEDIIALKYVLPLLAVACYGLCLAMGFGTIVGRAPRSAP